MLTENEVQECISILRKKIDAINKTRIEIDAAVKKIWRERFDYVKSTNINYRNDYKFKFNGVDYCVACDDDRYELRVSPPGVAFYRKSTIIDGLKSGPTLRFSIECRGRSCMINTDNEITLEFLVDCQRYEQIVRTRSGQENLTLFLSIIEYTMTQMKRIISDDLPAFDKFVGDKYVEAKKWEQSCDAEIIKAFDIKNCKSNIKAKSYKVTLKEVEVK